MIENPIDFFLAPCGSSPHPSFSMLRNDKFSFSQKKSKKNPLINRNGVGELLLPDQRGDDDDDDGGGGGGGGVSERCRRRAARRARRTPSRRGRRRREAEPSSQSKTEKDDDVVTLKCVILPGFLRGFESYEELRENEKVMESQGTVKKKEGRNAGVAIEVSVAKGRRICGAVTFRGESLRNILDAIEDEVCGTDDVRNERTKLF